MIHRGTYDGTIYHNPVNKFCIISVKTADKEVPQEARSTRRYRDHLIRFVATGYELPRTDAVELELDGEWTKGKYGVQLQVEQWREIVPKTKDGVEGYLASGLIKGIGPATAAQIVSRFGVETLDILQNHPERLLEVKGITENKLEDIKTSYAESRMLQDLMTLLSPFKITPKTALKIYQHFGPASVDILKKSPFELCQVSGFGFLRVDAIVQKNGGDLHDPMRVKGALFWALEDSNGIQPGQGSQGYGCDIPDDLCYQWSEDYFRDADAKEDQEQEEKFVPHPYYGKSSVKSSKKKKAEKKPAEKKKPEPKPAPEKEPAADGQMSLMDFGMAKAG